MKKLNEAEFTAQMCDALVRVNAHVMPMVGSLMQPSGYPDRYVVHTRWSGWLEMKVDHRVVTDLQRWHICELRKRGVRAWVVRLLNETGSVTLSTCTGDGGVDMTPVWTVQLSDIAGGLGWLYVLECAEAELTTRQGLTREGA